MKRFFTVTLFLAIFIISFSIIYKNMHKEFVSPENTLANAFKKSGARVVKSEIYFWGRLGAGCSTVDGMELLAESLSADLQILRDTAYSKKIVNNNLVKKVDINGETSSKTTAGISVQEVDKQGGTHERFVSVSIVKTLSSEGLDGLRKTTERAFEKNGIKPKVNSCITGYLNGRLDNDRLGRLSEYILDAAGARKVEGISDRELLSISAYAPSIENYIKADNKKVNFNVAIRYNSYENRTYIWLATPVITTEY